MQHGLQRLLNATLTKAYKPERGQNKMLEKLHDEMLTEAYVMSLFGLDPKDEKDVEHMKYLRNQKRIPNCSVTHRVRVYPRQALSDWLMAQLKTEPIKREYKTKAEKDLRLTKSQGSLIIQKAKRKRTPKTETTPVTEEPKNDKE